MYMLQQYSHKKFGLLRATDTEFSRKHSHFLMPQDVHALWVEARFRKCLRLLTPVLPRVPGIHGFPGPQASCVLGS